LQRYVVYLTDTKKVAQGSPFFFLQSTIGISVVMVVGVSWGIAGCHELSEKKWILFLKNNASQQGKRWGESFASAARKISL
jgi:hypothetical protein